MHTYTAQERDEFLKESNAIEGVYDQASIENAIKAWEYIAQKSFITPELVLATHNFLMREDTSWSNPALASEWCGKLRNAPVYIGGKEALGAKFLPAALENWCLDMNDNAGPDEEHSKHLHVAYEKIHPFFDGNGRTGRIFMNWWRIRNGLPILVIHEGKEQMEYYKWFK